MMSRTSRNLMTLVLAAGLSLYGCASDSGGGVESTGYCQGADSLLTQSACEAGLDDEGNPILDGQGMPPEWIDTTGASSGGSGSGSGSGSGGGGFGLSANPQIEVQWSNVSVANGDSLPFSLGAAEVGNAYEIGLIRITNLGNDTLELRDLTVTSVPDGLFHLESAAVSTLLPTSEAPILIEPEFSDEGLTSFSAVVSVVLDSEGTSPTGTITVRSNSVLNNAELLTFTLTAEGAEPTIQVNPKTVEFGNVSAESSDTKTITILNVGTGDLHVSGFVMSGNQAFSFLLGAVEWPVNEDTASQGVTFDTPLIIPAGSTANTSVRFAPIGSEPAEATLILFSNDPDAQSGTVVPISGNLTGPCISINPKKVDFGGKLIGVQARVEVEILSCGEGPLTVTGVSIVDINDDTASSTDFGLDLAEFVGDESGAEIPFLGPNDAAIVIPVNGTRTFDVTFTPDEINGLDPATGAPIPDLGIVRISSDAFAAELDVEIRGFGVEVECPTAVIVVQEGEEVIPQTKLHLIGSQSYAASGSISKYEWSVQQPVGSQSVFLPSASAPDPTFEVNVAGQYIFQLRVWDQNSEESCIDANYTVFVNPDEAIHVELLWHTPLDPDETDEGPEAGADLDLHFLHPFATGEDVDGDGAPDGWFDQPFDCFWFNAHPNWGSLDPAKDDDPGLDLDDTDGAGPENVNLNQPQDGMTYKVGVHYWNDHDFGPSLATVRVYIYSSLVFQLSDVELVNHDMWEVADIAWPSGEVTLKTDVGGSYKITPEYNHPFFPTPE